MSIMFTPTSPIFTPRPSHPDVYYIFRTPMGTLKQLKEKLADGLCVDEAHPETGDLLLNVIIRACVLPQELYAMIEALIQAGVDVNAMDGRGATPLSLLVLHINRGLRYHPFHDPELDRLIDLNQPKADIETKVIEQDQKYQECIHQCLQLLLSSGVDVRKIPARCPSLLNTNGWAEAFEHKLMQQENRWRLLWNHSSIEYSTYNMFNTFNTSWVENSKDVNIVHLAAWRGDARCLQLLMKAGCTNHQYRGAPSGNVEDCYCSITAHTRDGRNALHFLYQYCNKVSNLVRCTGLLLGAGVDPNAADKDGNTPLFLLLHHVHVKREYLRYLANAYTEDGLNPQGDVYFHAEIRECVSLLYEYGADFTHLNSKGDDPLLHLFTTFEQTLKDVDPEFQSHGHYMIPYAFSLKPLHSFIKQLVGYGCSVNCDTPYHRLIGCLDSLNLSLPCNTPESFRTCFKALFQSGAPIQKRNVPVFPFNWLYNDVSVLQHLVDFIDTTIWRYNRSNELPSALDHLLPVVTDVLHYMVISPTPTAATQHITFTFGSASSSSINWGSSDKILTPWCRLILHLIHSGFDPGLIKYRDAGVERSKLAEILTQRYPCKVRRNEWTGPETCCVTEVIATMVNCMSSHALWDAHADLAVQACPKAHNEHCPQCCFRETIPLTLRSLRVLSRYSIWKAMGYRFADSYEALPLPPSLKHYVRHLDIT